MVVYMCRKTGEAFACDERGEDHLRKMLFEEGRRDEQAFVRVWCSAAPVQFRAIDKQLLAVSTLDLPPNVLA